MKNKREEGDPEGADSKKKTDKPTRADLLKKLNAGRANEANEDREPGENNDTDDEGKGEPIDTGSDDD